MISRATSGAERPARRQYVLDHMTPVARDCGEISAPTRCNTLVGNAAPHLCRATARVTAAARLRIVVRIVYRSAGSSSRRSVFAAKDLR